MIQNRQIFGDVMSNLYWLSDEKMGRLSPYFPKNRGRPRVDDRRVLSGIIFINRNGLRWCDAPAECGPPKTLCTQVRFHFHLTNIFVVSEQDARRMV